MTVSNDKTVTKHKILPGSLARAGRRLTRCLVTDSNGLRPMKLKTSQTRDFVLKHFKLALETKASPNTEMRQKASDSAPH